MTLRSVYHGCNDCFIIHKLDSAVLFMLSSTLLNEHIRWDEMFAIKRIRIRRMIDKLVFSATPCREFWKLKIYIIFMKEGRNYVYRFDSHMRYCLLFDFPGLEILLSCIDYNLQNV